jgi:hypothetical protein
VNRTNSRSHPERDGTAALGGGGNDQEIPVYRTEAETEAEAGGQEPPSKGAGGDGAGTAGGGGGDEVASRISQAVLYARP